MMFSWDGNHDNRLNGPDMLLAFIWQLESLADGLQDACDAHYVADNWHFNELGRQPLPGVAAIREHLDAAFDRAAAALAAAIASYEALTGASYVRHDHDEPPACRQGRTRRRSRRDTVLTDR
jgi:hypothetical protein